MQIDIEYVYCLGTISRSGHSCGRGIFTSPELAKNALKEDWILSEGFPYAVIEICKLNLIDNVGQAVPGEWFRFDEESYAYHACPTPEDYVNVLSVIAP